MGEKGTEQDMDNGNREDVNFVFSDKPNDTLGVVVGSETDKEKVQPADEEGHETEVAVENGEAGEVVIGDEVEVAMVVDE